MTRKALSESAANPTITKTDVLRALQTDTDRLFPAPSLIKPSTGIVPREQEADLARQIIQTTGRAIIVHADAGVGKSVFATRIGQALPEGSVCILYDCFGNGLYRNEADTGIGPRMRWCRSPTNWRARAFVIRSYPA